MSGNAPVIFEDGGQSRDFIHVSDIVAAIVAALASGAADGQAVNVGTGRSVSVREVAEVLSRQLGVDLEPEVRNQFRAGDIRHCFASIDRAKELLGFAPATSFEDGMRDLISWLSGATRERQGQRGDRGARASWADAVTRSSIARHRAPSTSSLARSR